MPEIRIILYEQWDALNDTKSYPLFVSMLRFQGTPTGVYGVGIVCKIGYIWQSRPGEATRGEYAAYLGMSAPDAREDDAVVQIAQNGVKLRREEGELIFLEKLKDVYPHVQWHWRD